MHFRTVLGHSARYNHTWIKPEGYDTGIKVYNCVVKQKVPLIVRNKNFTSWYTCGPTVYDASHIGHASCYVKLDIVQRILRSFFNINLTTVMNVTDVDDKIIAKSTASNRSPMEIARHYEKEFWEDLQYLNVVKPNIVLRVTENISLINNFIQQLIDLNKAYVAADNSVYFDLSQYKNYGKLQNIGSPNIDESVTYKKSPMDFALWKAAKPGEPFWDSKFGPGRPGWHIECSTLASSLLGSTIDIHAGGLDLRFPHHENEEAQSCSYFEKGQWVNYWLHTGQLLLKETKMSKSLKNTISIRELLETTDADTFRMACLLSNYRNNMEFTKEFLLGAKTILKSYKFFMGTCNSFIKGQIKAQVDNNVLLSSLSEAVTAVEIALKDDFDTATVIKSINSLINTTNKMLNTTSTENGSNTLNSIAPIIAILNFVVDTLHMFGIQFKGTDSANYEQNELDEVLDVLVNFRQNVRTLGLSNKDEKLLRLCDNVRNDLRKCNITINDRGKVSSWTR